MNDSENYSQEPLSPQELAETRLSISRTTMLWAPLGPFARVFQDRRYWVALIAAGLGLNWNWVRAGINAVVGMGQ